MDRQQLVQIISESTLGNAVDEAYKAHFTIEDANDRREALFNVIALIEEQFEGVHGD